MVRNRRQFLKESIGVSTALASAPMFVPRSAWGANDRPAYGVIGTGGRGRYVSRAFQKQGAQCVAICDVYEPNLEEAAKDAPDAKRYVDYKELLAQSGIDGVLVATPDHQHCPNLLAALEAGKDVYVEKPMSHSLEESARMVKAVRQTSRIVQVGMQRRSSPTVFTAKRVIDDGMLGRITLAKPQWHWNIAGPLNNSPLPGKLDWDRFLGAAPKIALQPMRFRSWRLFWDYSGGNMTDQGTHLMDVVQWFTGNKAPSSAICYGQIAKSEGSEAPDVFTAVFEYPNAMASWTLDYCNSYENGWSITFMGDKGTMIMDEEGFTVYKEPWKENSEPIYKVKLGGVTSVEPHVANFLECMKTRKEPNCPVETGMRAVAAPHLANVAFKEHRQVRLGDDFVTTS